MRVRDKARVMWDPLSERCERSDYGSVEGADRMTRRRFTAGRGGDLLRRNEVFRIGSTLCGARGRRVARIFGRRRPDQLAAAGAETRRRPSDSCLLEAVADATRDRVDVLGVL